MPSYGSSSYKGQTISNAFFWAIGRSQDATILHDWFSKTGQAMAGEYRYISLGGSGNLRTDFLNEHPIDVRRTQTAKRSSRRGAAAFACTATSARASAARGTRRGARTTPPT